MVKLLNTNSMYIIGDVHGHLGTYWNYILWMGQSIQLGDFGFKQEHDWYLQNINYNNHKILFGNHDYYPYLDYEHSLGNWSYFSDLDLFCVRGAQSVDKWHRTQGVDWFEEEEMSYIGLNECINVYMKCKPKIVVSHDTPSSIALTLFGYNEKSLTRQAMDQMLQFWKPHIWIFGHHHTSKDTVIKGTRFICLNELEILKLC